jgi:hypothetical protein
MNPHPDSQLPTLDASAVMQVVSEGYAPGDWQVYRAHASYLIQRPILGLGLLAVVVLVWLRADPVQPYSTRVVMVLVSLLFGLLGLWDIWSGAGQFTNLREQALVLMPDGFVINGPKLVWCHYGAIQSLKATSGRYGSFVWLSLLDATRPQRLPLDVRFGRVPQRARQLSEGILAWQRLHG